MEVRNKKIILTGAASGVGKELTKLLLNDGATVVGIDVNEENLNTLKEELNNDNLYTYKLEEHEKITNFIIFLFS